MIILKIFILVIASWIISYIITMLIFYIDLKNSNLSVDDADGLKKKKLSHLKRHPYIWLLIFAILCSYYLFK
jgi:hypothetical protein